MKKIKTSLFTLAIFFPGIIFGQIVITEVMYDLSGTDTDKEWVEIQNNGTETVTITTGSGNSSWRFIDSSPHTLTLFSGENVLAPGQYAVIAKNSTQFMLDWPNFSGTLFTSPIALPNTTATLSVKNSEGNILDTYTYNSEMGAKGDGNSLQKVGTSFSPALPTPGLVNTVTQNSGGGSGMGTNTTTDANTNTEENEVSSGTSGGYISSAHSSPAPINEGVIKIDFEIYAGRDRLTTVGNNVNFRGELIKSQGITEQSINFQWSFGDGGVGYNKATEHSYRFPGEYNVVLNATYAEKQAVSRLVVRVISPEFTIRKIEGGIEVYNRTKQEINLNNWSLQSQYRVFKFPTDTLIGGDKKVVFPDGTTGLSVGDVKLLNPYGEILASYKEEVTTEKLELDDPVLISEMEKQISSLKQSLDLIVQTQSQNKKNDLKNTITKNVSNPTEPQGAESKQSEITEETYVDSGSIVFEAEERRGFVNKMLALPIKGIDFIFSLFKQ